MLVLGAPAKRDCGTFTMFSTNFQNLGRCTVICIAFDVLMEQQSDRGCCITGPPQLDHLCGAQP